MKQKGKIIFMGTAAFAVPVLDSLRDAGYDIAAVVTAPDRPAGRGKKIRQSPVKEYATVNGLDILQPLNLKDHLFIEQLKGYRPDLAVVVAFRMLPEVVWKIPGLGTINLHASLLPQLRGAAPINHAIINGFTKTGVTTFMIDEKIDTGRILKQAETDIREDETAGELHDRLMHLGAGLTRETVDEMFSGNITAIAQESLISEHPLVAAPKIFKEDCVISWDEDQEAVYNFIRGMSPSPGAFTSLMLNDGTNRTLKVYRCDKSSVEEVPESGSVRTDGIALEIACSNGYLKLTEIQLEGKKRMTTEDFLRGFDAQTILRAG